MVRKSQHWKTNIYPPFVLMIFSAR